MFCGIDPGRFKIGFALADERTLLFSAIIPKSEETAMYDAISDGAWERLAKWRREGSADRPEARRPLKIFLGGGTSSEDVKKRLSAELDVEITDEYGTTLEGRKLYWELHPPRGLWRFVPTSLRTPPRDIDDLAAWAIILKGRTRDLG